MKSTMMILAGVTLLFGGCATQQQLRQQQDQIGELADRIQDLTQTLEEHPEAANRRKTPKTVTTEASAPGLPPPVDPADAPPQTVPVQAPASAPVQVPPAAAPQAPAVNGRVITADLVSQPMSANACFMGGGATVMYSRPFKGWIQNPHPDPAVMEIDGAPVIVMRQSGGTWVPNRAMVISKKTGLPIEATVLNPGHSCLMGFPRRVTENGTWAEYQLYASLYRPSGIGNPVLVKVSDRQVPLTFHLEQSGETLVSLGYGFNGM